MRTLTQNELMHLAGGIQNSGENDGSRPFILGAGVAAIFSSLILETTALETLVASMTVGALCSVLIDPKSLPKKST